MQATHRREVFWWWAAVGAAALAGLALRIVAAHGGLWTDEAWSVIYAAQARDPAGVFLRINHDNNHHLYSLWLQAIGPAASPLLARAPRDPRRVVVHCGCRVDRGKTLAHGRNRGGAAVCRRSVAGRLRVGSARLCHDAACGAADAAHGRRCGGRPAGARCALVARVPGAVRHVLAPHHGGAGRHRDAVDLSRAPSRDWSASGIAGDDSPHGPGARRDSRRRHLRVCRRRDESDRDAARRLRALLARRISQRRSTTLRCGRRGSARRGRGSFRSRSARARWRLRFGGPSGSDRGLGSMRCLSSPSRSRPAFCARATRASRAIIWRARSGCCCSCRTGSRAAYSGRPAVRATAALVAVDCCRRSSLYRDSLLIAADRGRPAARLPTWRRCRRRARGLLLPSRGSRRCVAVAAERTGYAARFAGGCAPADFLLAAQSRWTSAPATFERCGVRMDAVDSSVTVPLTGNSWVLYRARELAKLWGG